MINEEASSLPSSLSSETLDMDALSLKCLSSPEHLVLEVLTASADAIPSPDVQLDDGPGNKQFFSSHLLPNSSNSFLHYYWNLCTKMQISNVAELLEGGSLIFVWYLCSLFSSNLSAMILDDKLFPHALSLTFFQFGFVSFCCLLLFKFGSSTYKMMKLDWNIIMLVLVPLCVSQILAHLLSQISFQHIPVSFTHTVKATSPIFAILLSIYFKFNEQYSAPLLFSIVPIIMGVALSSFNEINFKWIGFITALGSTIVFSWQNAFSKKVFRNKEMDDINLLFYTSLAAFVVLLPVWIMFDMFYVIDFFNNYYYATSTGFTNEGDNSGVMGGNIIALLLLNGVCHFGQNIAAFTLMTRVTPLTYTVFNTTKRLFVIICSILYFGNNIPFLNALGIGMAIGGVVLYNKAKFDINHSNHNHNHESNHTSYCKHNK